MKARTELLPLNGSTLANDARLLEKVRAIGVRHGFDYTDDAVVTELLAERRRTLERIQRGPLVWSGALLLTAAVIWPFLAPTIPELADDPVLSYAPAGPLLLIAVACIALVHLRWKRELTQGPLAGYREVLGLARAHGYGPTHVPAWLEGRSTSGGSGKGTAPVPAYPRVAPQPTDAALRTDPSPTTPSVPPKPEAVTAYERIADEGGWHDEVGCLLVAAGAGGAIWAATSDAPLGYAALVLVPVAVAVWLAGSRQSAEK
ncbi:hypothetical protein ABTZ90_02260 [Streptomyces cellulosae]